MPGSGQFEELNGVARRGGGTRVPTRELDWYVSVRRPMENQLPHAEREHLDRRRLPISIGMLTGSAAHQFSDDFTANPQLVRLRKIGDRRQTDGSSDPNPLRRRVTSAMARGRPEREMAAGRVADNYHTIQIQIDTRR